MLTELTKRVGGFREMLTMADKGEGDWGNADNCRQTGVGGSGPPFLADIICEQPLS